MNSPVPPINEGENGKLINQIIAMRWGSKSFSMKQYKWQNESFSGEGKVKFQNL